MNWTGLMDSIFHYLGLDSKDERVKTKDVPVAKIINPDTTGAER